jgi:hypothetical protein
MNIATARSMSECFIIVDLQPITKASGGFSHYGGYIGSFKAEFRGMPRKATKADLKTLCAIRANHRERPSRV